MDSPEGIRVKKGRESEHHFWGFPQVILFWSESVPNRSLSIIVSIRTCPSFQYINFVTFIISLKFLFKGGFYVIQHCFICRLSDSTVSEDAGIDEPRTVATFSIDSKTL
jgi:hypothetical protein